MQGKLLKLPQLLEEMFSKLWHVYLFKMKFFNDAVILFWIEFGWKVLRLFFHLTEFQTSIIKWDRFRIFFFLFEE